MWSIWLWGRLAGQVRPRTARRQPRKERDDARAPEVVIAGDDGWTVSGWELSPQAGELEWRSVGQPRREVHGDQVDRAAVDVELEVDPAAFGRRVAGHRPTGELGPPVGTEGGSGPRCRSCPWRRDRRR